MKKVTALAMAAVVAASALTGCGSSSTAETTAAATEAKTEAAAADSTKAAKEDGRLIKRMLYFSTPDIISGWRRNHR